MDEYKPAVLIVDDDALFRRTVARGFNRVGHETFEADTLATAMSMLRAHPTILRAVIDLHLGRTSGLDVLRALHDERPALRSIMCSAFCSTVVAVEALRRGALNCMPKSTPVGQLIAELMSEMPANAPPLDTDSLLVPSLAQNEWEHIQRVLHDCNGNVSLAARKLGIHRQSLQRKLRRYAPPK
jgi:two-component system, response regulator RegA